MCISISWGSAPCTTAPAPASTHGRATPACSAGCCWQLVTSRPSQGPLPDSPATSWPSDSISCGRGSKSLCSSLSPHGRAEQHLPLSLYLSKALPKPYLGFVPPSPGLIESRRAERASSSRQEDAAPPRPHSARCPQSFASSSAGCSSSR